MQDQRRHQKNLTEKKKGLDCRQVVQSPLFSLEDKWTWPESKLLVVQCELSVVRDDLGRHVISWCWSTVFTQSKVVDQELVEHVMGPTVTSFLCSIIFKLSEILNFGFGCTATMIKIKRNISLCIINPYSLTLWNGITKIHEPFSVILICWDAPVHVCLTQQHRGSTQSAQLAWDLSKRTHEYLTHD